ECLCDESAYLRDLSEQVFMRMGDEAGPVLLPLLEQGLWFTRTSAAGILGRLGYRAAVPALLRLADDQNHTVAEAPCHSLIAIGRQRGSFRIAHVLHRQPPDLRRRRLEELAQRDAAVAVHIQRMLSSPDLMALEDDGALADDSPVVSAGVETLAGSKNDRPRAREGSGGGRES